MSPNDTNAGGSSALDRLASGVGVALRTSAVAALMGLRWGLGRNGIDRKGIPAPRWDARLFSKVALDEFFLATELVSAPFVSARDSTRVGRELAQAIRLYQERGWLDDPADYHRTPPQLERFELEEFRSAWVDYRHLRYESEYEPHPGEPGRERWLGYAANRTAHARLLQHRGGPRPWLVCVPGYRMGQTIVDFTGFQARWLHRHLGLNVAIPVIPLHGPRRIGRRGGDGFFTGDFIDTVHAQAQAVWDARRLIGWLRSEGAAGVGIYGVSLGGYTAALLASLEHRIDCVIAGIPATDFLRLMQAHTPPFLLKLAALVGLSVDNIQRVLHVVSPLALTPQVPRERRFLFAGLADRLASPDHARDLWQHWERPHLTWYHGSHVSFLWEDEVKDLLQRALSTCGLVSQSQALTAGANLDRAEAEAY